MEHISIPNLKFEVFFCQWLQRLLSCGMLHHVVW
jgi:hypothetical protein